MLKLIPGMAGNGKSSVIPGIFGSVGNVGSSGIGKLKLILGSDNVGNARARPGIPGRVGNVNHSGTGMLKLILGSDSAGKLHRLAISYRHSPLSRAYPSLPSRTYYNTERRSCWSYTWSRRRRWYHVSKVTTHSATVEAVT